MKVLQKEIARASEAKSPPGSKKPGSRRSNAWNERNKSMKAALKKLENGELVADDVLNASVLSRLLLLATLGVDSLKVIVLDIPDDVALERMSERGRADDKGGFAEARLTLFRSSIGPILEFYQGDNLYIVDANKDRSEVQAEIDRILGQ